MISLLQLLDALVHDRPVLFGQLLARSLVLDHVAVVLHAEAIANRDRIPVGNPPIDDSDGVMRDRVIRVDRGDFSLPLLGLVGLAGIQIDRGDAPQGVRSFGSLASTF